MDKIKLTFLIILAVCISIIGVIFTNTKDVYYEANEVYRVYLNGKSLGIIKNEKELATYIDTEQQSLKEKYNVDTVYAPAGLSIEKEITYNESIESATDIYDKIKEEEDFTINGYIMTITSESTTHDDEGNETKSINKNNIYTMSKEIITDAINDVVKAFVDKEKYNQYLASEQEDIKDTGYLIENVYIGESITITKGRVPTNETIFDNSKTLAQYLLFGTTDLQNTYVVQAGDTVASIALANRLNTNELLVANQNLSGENSLLYPGQTLVVSLISPLITVFEETHNVGYQTINFTTETKEDSSMFIGETRITQEGVNGQSLLTTKVQKANGQIRSVVTVAEKVITPSVNRVVLSGTMSHSTGSTGPAIVGDGTWIWPTNPGYTLTDGFVWRWGKMHQAQDIAGLGCNSQIYAAQGGTVVTSTYHYSLGNYIEINHNNGYLTRYAHLSSRYVSVGTQVTGGQVIGLMGNTGESYGCHLHFGASYNGEWFDPMRLY